MRRKRTKKKNRRPYGFFSAITDRGVILEAHALYGREITRTELKKKIQQYIVY